MRRLRMYGKELICVIRMLTAWVIVHVFRRKLLKENLWLFQEKHTEARDNGYHLYVYVKKNHPEIPAYYAIVKGSPDEEKIRQYGNIIPADTLRHYIYWLAAKYSVSSQPNGAAPYPTDFTYRFRKLCGKRQRVIYLKHGVDKDELSHSLDYSRTGFSLVSFTAKREQEFMQRLFGYPDSVAQLVGFCRYDRLTNAPSPQKQLLVMPTFRSWLKAEKIEEEAGERDSARFLESDFYKAYSKLLTDESLLTAAREYGYKIIFYLHYSLQSYAKLFLPCQNDTVVVADRQHFDVQRLMLESAAMVTDFSSVFFDFAYMKRPEIFFQFDEERYRKDHYKPGYFDYRRDGFGPVFTEEEETRDAMIALMRNGCKPDEKYLKRVTDFFAFFDDQNCRRTFEAIQKLD